MKNYREELLSQQEELRSMIVKTEKKVEAFRKLPKGKLIVSHSNGCAQYYFRAEGATKAQYIVAKDRNKVGKYVRLEYNQQILKIMKGQEKALSGFLQKYDIDRIGDVYDQLCEERRQFVQPVEETEEMRVMAWYEQNIGLQNPFPMDGMYETKKGEKVRSKSEKILADLLSDHEIPYVYEPVLELRNGSLVYPDFAIYHKRKDQTLYWEHLGLAGEESYAVKNLEKIIQYEESGYYPGINLILSMEMPEHPYQVHLMEKKI